MADDALSISTARGEVKIATDKILDPTFGWVHLLRVSGAAGGGGSGMSLAEFQSNLPLPVLEQGWPASFGSVQSGAWNVGVNNFPASFNVGNFPAVQTVNVNNFPASQQVTGTFWQATQPVSAAALPLPAGASTEATLAALSGKHPATLGQKTKANSLAVVLASDSDTIPVSAGAEAVLFKGRAMSFNTPGRAGTTGQKILSIYNAGSNVKLYVTYAICDLAQTVVKAVTVAPFPIRVYKVTVAPTNGTVLAKTKIGGSTTSHGDITVRGDASGDNTGSGTALTATLPAGAFVTEEFSPRLITGAGYEMADRIEFLGGVEVELLANEGLVLHLEYTLATQNPTTDRWIAGFEWKEKT